ncbi:sensor histidine kinase [Streptomyces sp. AK08-02]|uniref:sensor histidine kinase n=1 Tax=Streptomyces sp. AK08-02 TaxID=3028654 RepID=UPI0029A9D28F|nr:histidine kinase [Streptomyces sp. AK08-02]MDX3745814.1 histidine kinase [Streptomyces sp. AK08-02]
MSAPNAAVLAAVSDSRRSAPPSPDDAEQRALAPIITRVAGWHHADQAHPGFRRWAVPVFCTLLGGSEVFDADVGPSLPVKAALTLALTVPLLWRERRPVLVWAVITVVSVVVTSLGMLTGASGAWIVALYNTGRYATLRQAALATAVTLTQITVAGPLFWNADQIAQATRPWVVLTMSLVVVTAFACLGLSGRLVNTVIAALETDRDQQARLSAARERARVSREMHDILGHTLAVIVGLADGGASLSRTKPERGAETLRIIGDSGRDALGELRRLLAVIGDEQDPRNEAPLAPQPGLADLEALLERVRAAGPTAALHTEGELTGLSQGVQLAVYRIVQEALTNTLKHSVPETDVTVTVSLAASVTDRSGALRVTVEDSGPSRPRKAGPAKAGSGRGLVGMRQRAALYDGSVNAGPNRNGGWSVRAVLFPDPPSGTTGNPTENLPA